MQAGDASEDSAAAFYEAKQGQIMENLWKLNVADIESTLTRVVDRVSVCVSAAVACRATVALKALLQVLVCVWQPLHDAAALRRRALQGSGSNDDVVVARSHGRHARCCCDIEVSPAKEL